MRLLLLSSLGLSFAATSFATAQSIDVPAGQHLVLTAEGRGVQIYRCDLKGEQAAWTFVTPEAGLFVQEAKIGSHGAGPVWMHKDGSMVRGKLMQSQTSPDAGAIPWLLLKSAETSGKGVFTTVTYIRRTATKGGQSDPAACDAAHAGATARVPYMATYSFYAAPSN